MFAARLGYTAMVGADLFLFVSLLAVVPAAVPQTCMEPSAFIQTRGRSTDSNIDALADNASIDTANDTSLNALRLTLTDSQHSAFNQSLDSSINGSLDADELSIVERLAKLMPMNSTALLETSQGSDRLHGKKVDIAPAAPLKNCEDSVGSGSGCGKATQRRVIIYCLIFFIGIACCVAEVMLAPHAMGCAGLAVLCYGGDHFLVNRGSFIFLSSSPYMAWKCVFQGMLGLGAHGFLSLFSPRYCEEEQVQKSLPSTVRLMDFSIGLMLAFGRYFAQHAFELDPENCGPIAFILAMHIIIVALYFRRYWDERLTTVEATGLVAICTGTTVMAGVGLRQWTLVKGESILWALASTLCFSTATTFVRTCAMAGVSPRYGSTCRLMGIGIFGLVWLAKLQHSHHADLPVSAIFNGVHTWQLLHWPFLNAFVESIGLYYGVTAFSMPEVRTAIVAACMESTEVWASLLDLILVSYWPDTSTLIGCTLICIGVAQVTMHDLLHEFLGLAEYTPRLPPMSPRLPGEEHTPRSHSMRAWKSHSASIRETHNSVFDALRPTRGTDGDSDMPITRLRFSTTDSSKAEAESANRGRCSSIEEVPNT